MFLEDIFQVFDFRLDTFRKLYVSFLFYLKERKIYYDRKRLSEIGS